MGRTLLLVIGRAAGRKICARCLHEGAARMNSGRVMAQHDLLTAGNAIADRNRRPVKRRMACSSLLMVLLGRSHPWKPDGFRPIDLWHDGTSDAAYPEVGAGALAYRNRLRELEKYAHMPQ